MTPRRPLTPWVWFAIGLAALGLMVAWLASGSGQLPDDSVTGARLVHGVVLAALIGAGLIHSRRMGFKGAVGSAFAWLAIGAALVLAYSYRFEAEQAWQRIQAELAPGRVQIAGERTISLRRASDGHFYVEAKVNGVPVRFMIDTGASSTVLDPRDAERAGFRMGHLAFHQRLRTANGTVRAAVVTASRLDFGPIGFADVRHLVNGAAIGTSLMGIETLQRFKSWRVADDRLTLEY
jgi:aspartyl protease family protein